MHHGVALALGVPLELVHVALINQPRRVGVNGLDVMSALGEPSVAARPRTAPPLRESVSAISPSPSGTTLPATEQTIKRAPERLALSRRANQVMRLHLVRSAVRITVLMTCDAAALLLLGVLLRGVRDQLWLGAGAGSLVNRLVP